MNASLVDWICEGLSPEDAGPFLNALAAANPPAVLVVRRDPRAAWLAAAGLDDDDYLLTLAQDAVPSRTGPPTMAQSQPKPSRQAA